MPKAAIYVRLSREDRNKVVKENDSESIINQQIMLLSFCEQQSWDVYKIYNDEDFSGSDRDRPAFNEMLKDAEQRKFDIVMCKTQSRFARDMELVEKYINVLFPIWGIRFIGLVDNADTENKSNKKSRQINSLVDQWYLEDLSENIKATLSSKRKQGLWVGAFAPYGYKKDPDNKNHLIIDDEAAKVVRYVFDLYLKGTGITSIARILNDEHIPNPATYKQQHGQPFQNINGSCSDIWHTFSISRMLSNQIYIGHTVQGIQENISYKSNKKRKKPKEEWDIVENTHEAIIDKTTWNLVQDIRQSKPRSQKTGKPNIFARKMRCLRCGSSMRIFYNSNNLYYACHTHFFAKNKCEGTYVSKAVVERNVLSEIRNLYNQYIDDSAVAENINFNQGLSSKIEFITERIKSAQDEIIKIDNRFKGLYYDKLDGVITVDEFNMLSDDCKEKKARQESLIISLKNEIALIESRIVRFEDKLRLISEFKDISELDNITVNTLIDYIEVGGNKNNRIINIHWNF